MYDLRSRVCVCTGWIGVDMATDIRLKVLPRVELRGHRYVWSRYGSQLITVAILFLVPLTGAARVDLYSGHHRMLCREADFREGLAGVIVGIAALYVVTFLINLACGRMFCGWGCPVGFLNRLSDVAQMKPNKNTPAWKLWRDRAGPYGHSFLLVFSCMLWWTSAEVFWAGFGWPTMLAWGVLVSSTAGLWALGWYARWRFCMTTCPIGLYYSFVAPSDGFGINFREGTSDGSADACLHCNACIKVCPVDLDPMNLVESASPRGGIALPDAPGNNHCLKCGDCIQACEMMIDLAAERRGISEVPLRFGFYQGDQRIERNKEEPEEAATSTDQ
ncbi:MAG: 4Fe-4S dicluster domain-containing protein [Planctomycetes bacterium]|nr:4Fe-4S dicluster domain-containing protein [Planctomycetota bacterium]